MSDGVPTESVLRVLRRLIEVHKGAPSPRPGHPVIVPISLMERDRWRQLIREVLEQEDGALVDASDCKWGVRAGNVEADSPGLMSAVQQMLDAYNSRNPSANLRLILDDGFVTCEGDQSREAAHTAQGVLRDLAVALCSDNLRASEFAALSYAEEPLDFDTRRSVWDVLMRLPDLLGAGQNKTLIVFAGDSQPIYSLHCTGNPSLAYMLDKGGLRERKTWVQNAFDVEELARHSKSAMPLVTLFLGAGSSAGSGLPLGNAVRDRALESLTREPVSSGTFAAVAGRFFDRLAQVGRLTEAELAAGRDAWVGGLTLERVIAVEQAVESQKMTSTLSRFKEEHDIAIQKLASELGSATVQDPLRELLSLQSRFVLVTVNFDHVLETRAAGLVKPIITDADMEEFPSTLDSYIANGGPVPLLKMHGDIHVPESLVANLEETTAGLSVVRSRAINHLIRRVSEQEQRPWWYVGYSMRDADLAHVWTDPHFVRSMNEHWVSPFLDENVGRFISAYRLRVWRDNGRSHTANEKLLTLTADDLWSLLAADVASKWKLT